MLQIYIIFAKLHNKYVLDLECLYGLMEFLIFDFEGHSNEYEISKDSSLQKVINLKNYQAVKMQCFG